VTRPNPYTVPCPKCGAAARQLCVRLSGPYGQGQPLRRAHRQRHAAVARTLPPR
jgi:hypothetical protein